MERDELIYWLKKEAEEYKKDGGLQTNFDCEINLRTLKTDRQLYPSLINDENFNETEPCILGIC